MKAFLDNKLFYRDDTSALAPFCNHGTKGEGPFCATVWAFTFTFYHIQCVCGKALWLNLQISFVNSIHCIAAILGRFP